MRKIQVCFQIGDEEHNQEVINKLVDLKNNVLKDSDLVISCHLPRKIVEEKGFSTDIVDAFENIFGKQYKCMCVGDTYEKVMNNMNYSRSNAAAHADLIYVIGEQSIKNIALEIELFTHSRVQFI